MEYCPNNLEALLADDKKQGRKLAMLNRLRMAKEAVWKNSQKKKKKIEWKFFFF
jgi:hypothetical protein